MKDIQRTDYHDLPIPNLTFAVQTSDVAGALIVALADRTARLRAERVA
jgi:hypothetical protein